jgi:hypothetical protein
MQIEFKVTMDSTEHNELLPYSNATERDMFLWKLFHNFFRAYENLEEDPSLDKVKEDLFELKEKYKVILE